MQCVFLGLSITSTWGNGHATTYRGLLKELRRLGHSVTFLERDVPWYASNREFSNSPYCSVELYRSIDELKDCFTSLIRTADLVVVGSYVPEGIEIGRWVTSIAKNCTAFYDIDTPVTLSNLSKGKCEYLSYDLYPQYNLYLSFTGGPTLDYIERQLGSPAARALYCSVDPSLYFPEKKALEWDLGYLGTYAADRQPALEKLFLGAASRYPQLNFVCAGPQYPGDIRWPENVQRIEHLPAAEHCTFYNSQRFALNLTRQDMIASGYSPSVRLFEAAACGTPIITDEWAGLSCFFEPHSEILPVSSISQLASYLAMHDEQRLEIAERARHRTLRFHTAAVRAQELELQVSASLKRASASRKRTRVAPLNAQSAALI